MTPVIKLRHVDDDNWRACADLEVAPEQRDFVSPVARYLCLCHYGGVWRPLAVYAGDEVVERLSPTGRRTPGSPTPWFSGILFARCARSSVGSERRSTEPKVAGSSPAVRAILPPLPLVTPHSRASAAG